MDKKEYQIEIVETLSKTVTVTADSSEEALSQVRRAFRDSEIILDADNFLDAEIFEVKPIEQDLALTALCIKPQRPPEEVRVNDDLVTLQGLVQGPIEVISPFADDVVIICNEEGKLEQLPYNRVLSDERGNIQDVIVGNFLIVGIHDGEFTSLNKDMLNKYSKKFENIETFSLNNGKLNVTSKPTKSKSILEQLKQKEPIHDKELRDKSSANSFKKQSKQKSDPII